MPRLSASVVMYGSPLEARRCIDSLALHTPKAALYLVDNASPGGALARFCESALPPRLTVLPLGRNRGFGAGHNAALPLLRSEYHAVVNPDILLHGDAIGAMAGWMDAHPDVALTTPHMIFPDGREQPLPKRRPALLPLAGRQLPLRALQKHVGHYLMLDEDLSRPTDVEFCSGSFFVIRTAVLRAIGGFDEKYFMYVEDADITQKALRRGRAVYLPQVTVTHAWHRAAHRNPRHFAWQLKSMLRYFRKWGFRLS